MIIIRVEDRTEFGQGHRSRAIALAQACERSGTLYRILAGDKNWYLELLKQGLCSEILLVDATDVQDEALSLAAKLKDLNASIVILDGFRFGATLVEILAENLFRVALIDDTAEIPKPGAWCVVNPNIYATDALYEHWGIKSYTGGDYILLREPFINQAPLPMDGKIISLALGLFGGQDLFELLEKEITALGFKTIIPNKLDSSGMASLIDMSHLVICGASVTLHEVWSRDRFALPVYQAKDQQLFSKYLANIGMPFITSIGRPPKQVCNEIINAILDMETIKTHKNIRVNRKGSDLLMSFLTSR